MSGQNIETKALLNPPWQPSARLALVIDSLSWALPVIAALTSIGGGIAALQNVDNLAAGLGIFAGIASAAGVLFTGLASRIRDNRLTVTHAVASLGLDIAEGTQSMYPQNF
jgi:hypothetical protein